MKRGLTAFGLGAGLGILTLAIEVRLGNFRINPDTAATYGLLSGGLLAIVACLTRLGSARLAIVAMALLGAIEALYFTSTSWLRGEPWWTARSLAVELGIVCAIAGAALGVTRLVSRVPRRPQPGRFGPIGGAAMLIALVTVVAATWPRLPADPVRSRTGPNLVLIVLDGVRRDHVGLYGYPRATTPTLDALAPRARVYDAYAASSHTGGAIDRLLRPRALANRVIEHRTVQANLRSAGYVTAAFTDNPNLTLRSRSMRGFDRIERSVGLWRQVFRRTILGLLIEWLDAGDDMALVDKTIAWARAQRGPVFLYVHLMDSHAPFTDPPIDGRERPGRRIVFPVSGMTLTRDEADDIVARYDSGVRRADEQAGRLLADVSKWGRPFVAIVTSDHGESLGESGRWFHGGSLAPELLGVPLLVAGEGVTSGRVTAPVGHASIVRTLLDIASVACDECSGSDLRTSTGDSVIEGGLAAESGHGQDLSYRIAGGYKLVLNRSNGRVRLYDLRNDPLEQRDVAHLRADVVAALRKGLDAQRYDAPSLTPEELDRLRSLGYVR
ncbi:MAG: sulfatase [Acidobacteria bacterium]|nr:sulfatase [Acidobacteriota bacterium]